MLEAIGGSCTARKEQESLRERMGQMLDIKLAGLPARLYFRCQELDKPFQGLVTKIHRAPKVWNRT
jgi:hypothetical protein